MQDNASNTLVPVMPKITIAGKEYTLKRLGLGDVLKAGKILVKVGPSLAGLNGESAEDTAAMVLLEAVIDNNEGVLELIGGIFGLKPAQVVDPEIVPLADLPLMLEALVTHPDIEVFVKNLQLLIRSPALGEMGRRLNPSREKSSSGN